VAYLAACTAVAVFAVQRTSPAAWGTVLAVIAAMTAVVTVADAGVVHHVWRRRLDDEIARRARSELLAGLAFGDDPFARIRLRGEPAGFVIDEVNRAAEALLDRPGQALLGRGHLDVVHPGDRKAERELLERAVAVPGRAASGPSRRQDRAGGWFPVRVTVVSQPIPGLGQMATVTIEDLRLEAAVAAERRAAG
jgi:PAS domain S-box-containing protein